MEIKDLNPNQALKDLLIGKVNITLSESESRTVAIYKQGERPNVDLGDEFIDVLNNGIISSTTKPFGMFKGNLAVTLYCKANADGTAKLKRINSMLSQVESLVKDKKSGDYFFEFVPNNVITPITVDSTSGYAILVVNISWYTLQ
jgi:hypothetical protein